MRHLRYFLLTPRPVVEERLKSCAASRDFASIAQAVLWSAEESDRSALCHEDVDALVKLLFLDTLRREQSSDQQFSTVFPDFAVSEGYFDIYWSLARISLDTTAEEALDDAISSGSIDSWAPTGNARLDDVLAEYKRRMLK